MSNNNVNFYNMEFEFEGNLYSVYIDEQGNIIPPNTKYLRYGKKCNSTEIMCAKTQDIIIQTYASLNATIEFKNNVVSNTTIYDNSCLDQRTRWEFLIAGEVVLCIEGENNELVGFNSSTYDTLNVGSNFTELINWLNSMDIYLNNLPLQIRFKARQCTGEDSDYSPSIFFYG